MKHLIALVALTLSASAASAAPCRVGALDRIEGRATGIVGGRELMTLEHGTIVQFIGVPGGLYPNYEVVVPRTSNSIIVGGTTAFNECSRGTCQPGAIVTLQTGVNGVQNGTDLVSLSAGERVQILDVPRGLFVNYEIARMESSAGIILGATTRFQGCGR